MTRSGNIYVIAAAIVWAAIWLATGSVADNEFNDMFRFLAAAGCSGLGDPSSAFWDARRVPSCSDPLGTNSVLVPESAGIACKLT